MEKKKKNLPSSKYFEKKQKSLQKPTKCSSSSTQKRKKKIKSNNSCKDIKLPTCVTDWIMCPKERKDGRIDKVMNCYRRKVRHSDAIVTPRCKGVENLLQRSENIELHKSRKLDGKLGAQCQVGCSTQDD
ncbi:hypothetical protein Fmac_026965 [Flemingia macrophylla]|uniref:Uncharacterized protein n=1 Tax=Flemingia macrophylla TaxID=520843 RepID=A0ABD1LGD5_9FABA